MFVGEREDLAVGRRDAVNLTRRDGRLGDRRQRGGAGGENPEATLEHQFEPAPSGCVSDLVRGRRCGQELVVWTTACEQRLASGEESRCIEDQDGTVDRHQRSVSARRSAAVIQEFARSIVSEQTTLSTPAAAR